MTSASSWGDLAGKAGMDSRPSSTIWIVGLGLRSVTIGSFPGFG